MTGQAVPRNRGDDLPTATTMTSRVSNVASDDQELPETSHGVTVVQVALVAGAGVLHVRSEIFVTPLALTE